MEDTVWLIPNSFDDVEEYIQWIPIIGLEPDDDKTKKDADKEFITACILRHHQMNLESICLRHILKESTSENEPW